MDAVLVTRFLDHSSSYRALFANARYGHPTDRLLDALVELLVRLHLAGFLWGDCSPSPPQRHRRLPRPPGAGARRPGPRGPDRDRSSS
ncbi:MULTISPECIES: hypothetical protein [Actinomadura]|uniref:hypothetical protein n=1 Tax=Actinomadura sp. NPDC000929 TaxID=3154517 RepID=UPI003391AC72